MYKAKLHVGLFVIGLLQLQSLPNGLHFGTNASIREYVQIFDSWRAAQVQGPNAILGLGHSIQSSSLHVIPDTYRSYNIPK
jgi:hypothetical protein